MNGDGLLASIFKCSSYATAAVALLAVWKAWPTELERWAEAGNRGNRGDRDRGRAEEAIVTAGAQSFSRGRR